MKYHYSPYDNPALTLFDEDDYSPSDLTYLEQYNVLELTDAEYDAFCETEHQYNAAHDFLGRRQEEYAEKQTK
jgi:hypothetical protein